MGGRRFRHEALVVGLVLLTAFGVMQSTSTQDETRLALTRALVTHGSVRIDRWRETEDRAFFAGHYYTDKAPGLSVAAIPAYGIERAAGGTASPWRGRWSRWLVRLLVNGPLLAFAILLVGRRAESLAEGSGAVVAVALGLGTILGALASILFDHVGAAAIAFAAFVLAMRDERRPVWAGALAGTAVLFDYSSGIVLCVLGVAVAVRGLRRAAWYAAGAVPPLLALAAYDQAAFGSPFHLSYRYVQNHFAAQQHSGLFGVGMPSLQDLRAVLVGGSGLHVGTGFLVTSPLLLASAAGAVLLWRRGLRLEVAVIACVSLAYLVYDAGYFLPYGGSSPGPRFAATALPFAVLPLAEALRRARIPTLVLVALSVGVSTADLLAWMWNNGIHFHVLPPTIWSSFGFSRGGGVAVVCVTAGLATAAAVVPAVRPRARPTVPAADAG